MLSVIDQNAHIITNYIYKRLFMSQEIIWPVSYANVVKNYHPPCQELFRIENLDDTQIIFH